MVKRKKKRKKKRRRIPRNAPTTSASALEKDRTRALHLAMPEIKRATEIEKTEIATETKTGIEIEIEIVTEIVTATAIGIEIAIEGEENLRAKGGTRTAKI